MVAVQTLKSAPVSTIRRIWSNHQAARSRPQGRNARVRRGERRIGFDGMSNGNQAAVAAVDLFMSLRELFIR